MNELKLNIIYFLNLINNTEFKSDNSNKFLYEFLEFINLHGYRSVGFDLKDSIWIEDPQIVLNILNNYYFNRFILRYVQIYSLLHYD